MPAVGNADRPGERRLGRLVLVVALGLGTWLLTRGWGRWGDVLIDFGRELYVPWRLLEGEVLYRDIAHFNGPLSPYFNALCFRLFGTGMWTLAWVNLALLGLWLGLFFRRLVALSSELAAAGVLCFTVAAFAFGQQAWSGNYNFIAPYSHEVTHGLFLGMCALASAARPSGGMRGPLRTGLLLGLVFLTKPEPFLAAACGVAVHVFAGDSLEQPRSRALLWILLGGALPVLVAGSLLSLAMPMSEAWTGLLGSWPHLLNRDISGLAFYRSLGGWDAPGANVLVALQSVGWLLAAVAPGVLVARRFDRGWDAREMEPGHSLGLLAGLFCASFVAWSLLGAGTGAPAFFLARGLPLALALLVLFAWSMVGRERDPDRRRALAGFAALTVFGLVLTAKILLNVRFHHYGVFLALPGTAALLAFLLFWLPDTVARRTGARGCIIACVFGVYAAAGVQLLGTTEAFFSIKSYPLGEGRDALRTDFRGPYVESAIEKLSESLGPEEELLVLPEGVSLNYLTRRKTPTRFLNFMPLELLLNPEEEILSALEENPPAAVLFVHKDTTEYGYPFFGRDYGRGLYRWVRENYEEVWVDSKGGAPLEPGTVFGIGLHILRP